MLHPAPPEERFAIVTGVVSDGSTKTIEVPEGIDPGFAYRPGEMPVDAGRCRR